MSQDRRALRALFLIDRLAVGGTETQLRILIRQLDRGRIEPYLACLHDEGAPTREDLSCKVVTLGAGRQRATESFRNVFRLRRLLKDEAIDIVIAFFPDSEEIGALAARWVGIPVVAGRRNVGHWHTPGKLRRVRAVNRLVDHYVANSFAAREVTLEREVVSPDKVSVVYNILELGSMKCENREAGDGFRICCVANLRDIKGHEYLLPAMAELVKAIPGATLDLVGDGPCRSRLEADCRSLGLQAVVRFLGNCAKVPQLLGKYDVGVLPSLAESFPNSILECMAAGLPVVATNVGGTPEIVDSSVGRLVPPKDVSALANALVELAADGDLCRRLGAAGRNRVESRFSAPKILEDWYTVLEAVARRSR